MAEAEPKATQPKVKVLRRTSVSSKYIKADAELQHAATQYFTATAEFSDKLKQVEEASANLKQKLVPKLGFDGEVDWRVIATSALRAALSLKRYSVRRSLPLGRETDKTVRARNVLRGLIWIKAGTQFGTGRHSVLLTQLNTLYK